MSAEGCVLRVLAINDVYEIDYWPNFATANAEQRAADSVLCPGAKVTTISVLPGDFVSPALLSSLDKGKSMVDCMNKCGMDYVSIGNHESDIPVEQLQLRMRESKFQWINSNIRGLPLPSDMPPLPEYSVVEVASANGEHVRRVALVGLCGEDRSVMKVGAFGGADILPLMDSLKDLYTRLTAAGEKIDAIIPLTHQLMPLDRLLAGDTSMTFPVVIGGRRAPPTNIPPARIATAAPCECCIAIVSYCCYLFPYTNFAASSAHTTTTAGADTH
jgi:2',3'-cyclic-nucleotide 2'-phosphodiesterase (5'-nucleotidase family)